MLSGANEEGEANGRMPREEDEMTRRDEGENTMAEMQQRFRHNNV